MKQINDTYIIDYGNNGCNIPYTQINEYAQQVINAYPFSSPKWWMWKMFQLGFAYGKRKERARKKGTSVK